ncbi:MAG TPA: DUF3231 family protein [Bacillota bacterium]|nr:DUF3231 family protein [Bacillota bacterium]
MNILEIATDILKSYKESNDTALHVGEVMNLWTFLTATENFTNGEEVNLNKVKDEELREKMIDLIENLHKPIIKDIKKLLLNEGVELPRNPVEKPQIQLDAPPGAKLTDEEVANFVVFNIVWAIKFCARGLTESVRPDVGALFTKAIVEKAAFSLTLKQLMADKGWLNVPPPYKVEGSK